MGRATSAGVYGSSWIDLGRVPARSARRAYGLRTPNCPDGWVSAGGRARKRRVSVDPSTNLVEPIATADEDAPVRRYVRTDYAAERHAAGVIVMGEF